MFTALDRQPGCVGWLRPFEKKTCEHGLNAVNIKYDLNRERLLIFFIETNTFLQRLNRNFNKTYMLTETFYSGSFYSGAISDNLRLEI